jgi:hypothetical protein
MGVGLIRALPRIPCRLTFICRSVPPGACGSGQMPFRLRRPTALRIPPQDGEHGLRGDWRVVSKGPCTTSRCTIRPIPGDVVYGDDIERAGARSFRRWPVADDRLITTLGASPLLDWSSGCSRMGGVPCDRRCRLQL